MEVEILKRMMNIIEVLYYIIILNSIAIVILYGIVFIRKK